MDIDSEALPESASGVGAGIGGGGGGIGIDGEVIPGSELIQAEDGI